MSLSSVGLAALGAAAGRMQVGAAAVASSAAGWGGDMVSGLVALKLAQTQAQVGVRLIRVGAELQKSMLDLLA